MACQLNENKKENYFVLCVKHLFKVNFICFKQNCLNSLIYHVEVSLQGVMPNDQPLVQLQ